MLLKLWKITVPNLKTALKVSLVLAAFWHLCCCGVKGDPKPPDLPPEMGHGQPTYRKATEKIPLQKYNPGDEEKEDKEPEDE